jgi:exopolyphosphatase/guanosine-5'-triphosphate,3'-diphosphate pyrophosphatase
MRLAAIDIGTNSVHMIIVRVRPDFSFEIVDREKEMVRLGAGGLDGKKLTPDAMTAALQALSKFARLAKSHEVDEILAVATSATREAENGGAFLKQIERRTGIRARIITGTEEARLIHLAAVYGVDTPKPSVVIDIGGGSVEITRGTGNQVDAARSFKLGVIRLTERFVDSDPISSRDERKMTKFIREEVDRYVDNIVELGFDRVIGTSGTILSLGMVATAIDREAEPQEVRNLRVPAKSLRRLRKTVVEMDLEERMRLPGLDPRRADLMVAGAILLDTLLKRLGAEEITLCDLALREGVLLDYIHGHRKHIARVDSYPDVRRRSVIELAERCEWEADHSTQVAALALTLFDYTKRIHGLGDDEREWLEYASFLHDAGNHISYGKHHRHSYYLIKNGDLRGFEPEEIDVIALLTRYHRRATPKSHHPGMSEISKEHRRAIAILSAFLRLAETLDRSRHGVIRGIEVRERLGRLHIKVQAIGDAELEVWAANKQAFALEEALDRKVQIEKVPYRKSSAPSLALLNNSAAAAVKHDFPRRRSGDRTPTRNFTEKSPASGRVKAQRLPR